MHRNLLALVAGATCVSGCGRVPAAAVFQVVDSAGVSIASSRAPSWRIGDEWRVDSLPVFDVGGVVGPLPSQFTDVSAALLLPDGGILVGEASDATLRFFNPTGKPMRTVGRKGEGPGEYKSLGNIRSAGDSIVVWDDQLRRLSILAPDGNFVRGVPVQFKTGRYTFPRLAGRGIDGGLLFSAEGGVSSRLPIGVVRGTVVVFRVSPDGERDTLLGRWPWSETMAITGAHFVSDITVPYQKHATMRWGGGGFWIGTADQSRIDYYTGDGRLSRSVRWAATATPVTGDELNRWRTQQLAPFDTMHDELAAAFREGYAKSRFPEVRPPYRSFLVSSEGELLVQRVPRWDAEGSAAVWDVFGPDGQWLGPMNMPADVTPLEWRGDRLLARWNDADGVAHVRVYRLLRGP